MNVLKRCLSVRQISVGSLVAQNRRNRQLKNHLTKNLDVSSPVNPLLDTESLGMNTRITNYIIAAPTKKISDVIYQLAHEENRTTDLVANLIHRAMEVIEEIDTEQRSVRRNKFQSQLFSVAQKLFLEQNFNLFAFYDKRILGEISAKIQPKKLELISSLITQPLLRLAVLNRAIYIDPNKVFHVTGVDGFKKISDLFLIQFWHLKPELLDKYLNSFVTRKGPQFDIVRVWMMIASSSDSVTLTTPIVPGSKWNLKKLLQLIICKKSEPILREIFRSFLQTGKFELVSEMVYMCRSSHTITGTLRYPWAVETLEKWFSNSSDLSKSFIEQISEVLQVSDRPDLEPIEPQTIQNSPWDASTFLIDSHSALMEFKLKLFSSKEIVGISFPHESIVSVTTDDCTYVIDLLAVEQRFVSSILKRLLNDQERVKIVFSLSNFLLHIQDLLGDTVHFENLIEVRGNRVRRRSGKPTREQVEQFITSVSCPGVDELTHTESESSSSSVSCEWFSENRTMSLRELSVKWLGIDHDRAVCIRGDSWDIRPLPDEYLKTAANDSRVLVMLETRWRQKGILPVETLSFDPFEQYN